MNAQLFRIGFTVFILAYLAPCTSVETSIQNSKLANIQSMKNSPKGPFNRIRWFCEDGTILPPTPFACKPHGGGRQHGEWNQEVINLRQLGFPIATIYTALSENDFVDLSTESETVAFMVIERFLMAIDDGWIFQQASNYRGALQVESENRQAENLLKFLISQPKWLDDHYVLLREAVRLMPNDDAAEGISEARALASELAEFSADFREIRNKVHNRPSVNDIRKIARLVEKIEDPVIIEKAQLLQEKLRQAFVLPEWQGQLQKLLVKSPKTLKAVLTDIANSPAESSEEKIAVLANLMMTLRENINQFTTVRSKLMALRLSTDLEQAVFIHFSRLDPNRNITRQQRLKLINNTNAILFGMGLLRPKQFQQMLQKFNQLEQVKINLQDYKNQLDYISLVPSWAAANLHLQFATAMDKFLQLEPQASYYYDDRLRTSVLLYATHELDMLIKDANQLSGLTHVFFDQKIGHGLRRLNPGLTRGQLVLETEGKTIKADQIVLVSATTEDLPPVAGILTAKEGNALSHVQLLARNLGIPNAVVSESLMTQLKTHDQSSIILATSPGGVVQILANAPEWDQYFARKTVSDNIEINPDLKKLNLKHQQLTNLNQLTSRDSGRIVGPKAANLGQLKQLFPEAVTEGVALPFGLFKYYLDKPYRKTGESTYQWMLKSYQHLKTLESKPDEKQKAIALFLTALRTRIQEIEFEPSFLQQLKQTLDSIGGAEQIGIFIRSDTNVEDLAGFTGAGLNLTLPNVKGFSNIVQGIKDVWASPFTERAFAWRQRHMSKPEHVYTAVLLLRSVNSAVSGVMVTTDLNSGDNRFLTIAANEGIGGAVDNQAAETIRVNRETGEVTLLQPASASKRKQLSENGGLQSLTTTRKEQVLNQNAIEQLIKLSNDVLKKYPQFISDNGNVEPADIEFGFIDDKLVLFQIRPFLQNPNSLKNEYLQSMDRQLTHMKDITVNLSEQTENR